MQTLAILGLFSNQEEARAGSEALAGLGIASGRIHHQPHTGMEGGYIVSAEIDNESQFESAAQALIQLCARNIGRQSTTWDQEKWDRPTLSQSTDGAEDGGRDLGRSLSLRIPVIEERLKIEKRLVQRGRVQVFQSIEQIPFKERVALRVDRVLVERNEPACTLSDESDKVTMKTTYELREYAEEPVVVRTPWVIEEVVIGSELVEHEVEVNDVIRRAHVEVKRADDFGFQ